jgi:hypothetical protein
MQLNQAQARMQIAQQQDIQQIWHVKLMLLPRSNSSSPKGCFSKPQPGLP